MQPFFHISTKSLMSILQSIIILAAASFLMIHNRRALMEVKNEMELANSGWSGEWKVINHKSPRVGNDNRQERHRRTATAGTPELTHLPPYQPQEGPKLLWGITSEYLSEMELRRRGVVRMTYLSYFKNNDHFVSNPDRICSLADVLEKKVHFDRCQLVYTFVMGGNPIGAEEFVDPQSTSNEYLADLSKIPNAERDATYLNIRENQFGGKMQTWFAYASSLIKEGYAFDYVVKADSDSMLYPEEFLNEVSQSLPSNPNLIYSGVSVSRKHCGKKRDEHCNKMIKEYYMGGAVEILSSDLAHHITSLSDDRRRQLEISNHEDITIGNFVLSHPEGVTKVELGKPWGYKVRRRRLWVPVLWRHDKKTKQPGKLLAKFFIYEKENRRKDSTHENIMILPTSDMGERLIKSAIKSACIRNRKSVVEYCSTTAFSGNSELYLSRFTTDFTPVEKIDSNSTLSFQLDHVDKFVDPGDDTHVADDSEDVNEEENEDVEEAEKDEKEDNDAIVDTERLPWKETVVVVVRNPINDHMNEWLKVILPNVPTDQMPTISRNERALAQLQKSTVNRIYVVRVEHLWEDIVALEEILGNPHELDPAEWPALTDPSIQLMSDHARGQQVPIRMCCQLSHEISAYYELLTMGENLKNSAILHSALKEVSAMCAVRSMEDLARTCKQEARESQDAQ